MMGTAPFSTYKLIYALLNISSYKHVFVSIFKGFCAFTQKRRDAKLWTRSNERLPAARHTGNSTLKIRPHTTSEAIALRCEGQSGQRSWTRDGTASFERLYTAISMRPASKLPVNVSLSLKKCFMCVSSGWKCIKSNSWWYGDVVFVCAKSRFSPARIRLSSGASAPERARNASEKPRESWKNHQSHFVSCGAEMKRIQVL